jgi:hypothetical protein
MRTGSDNFKRIMSILKTKSVDIDKEPVFMDLHASKAFVNFREGALPCLTASRAAQGGFYISNQKRMTRVTELGRLQGLTTAQAGGLLSTISFVFQSVRAHSKFTSPVVP